MAIARIGRGVTYIAVLNSLQIIVGIVFYNILSRALGPAEIGVFSTLTFAYVVQTVLAPLALHVSVVKYVAEYLGRGQDAKAASVARTTLRIVLLSSSAFLVVFLVIALIAGGMWGGIEDMQVLLAVAAGAGFIAPLRITYLALIQAIQLFDKYAVANLSAMIASRFFGILLVWGGCGLLGAVLGMLIGEVVGLAVTYFLYKGRLPRTEDSFEVRELLGFTLPILTMLSVAVMQDWSDRILFLAVSGDLKALGVFDLVIRAASSLALIGAVVDVVVLPTFSESFGRKGTRGLSIMMAKALRYLGLMYFPAAFGLASISRTAMTVLYQANLASEGNGPLTVLALFSILGGFSTILNSGLKSIGETSSFVKISLLALAVDAIFVVTLSPVLGLYGAVAARAGSFLVIFIYTFFELKKKLPFALDVKDLARGLSAALSVVPPTLFVEYFIHFNSIFMKLVLEVVVAATCYLAALLLMRMISKEDFDVVRQVVPSSMGKLIGLLERLYVR